MFATLRFIEPMELVIHCGAHKTGTSSIQSLLFDNRDVLLTRGTLYIRPEIINRSGLVQFLHGVSGTAATGDRIRQEIKDARKISEVERVVISHESLFSYAGVYPAADGPLYPTLDHALSLWPQLCLDEIFSRQRAIFYVRRQDTFLQSLYLQYLSGGMTETFREFRSIVDHRDFSWLRLANSLAGHFGKENLIVRPFELIKGGWENYITDFFQAIGIGFADAPPHPRVENESFSIPAYYLALLMYPRMESFKREEFGVRLKKRFPPARFGRVRLISRSYRDLILSDLEDDNRELFSSYIKDFPSDYYSGRYQDF